MRNPNEIAFENGTLADALELHREWLAGEEGGKRLVLPDNFDLRWANLSRANLSDVKSMFNAIGNRDQIKGMQIERYTVTYDAVYLQIGCQRHTIERWSEFSDAQIRVMDGEAALAWWEKWKPVIFQIIEMSPANPTGYVEKEGE